MGPGDLSRALAALPTKTDPRLLVGRETFDDAGVFRVSDDLALVQTVDFFAPIVAVRTSLRLAPNTVTVIPTGPVVGLKLAMLTGPFGAQADAKCRTLRTRAARRRATSLPGGES